MNVTEARTAAFATKATLEAARTTLEEAQAAFEKAATAHGVAMGRLTDAKTAVSANKATQAQDMAAAKKAAAAVTCQINNGTYRCRFLAGHVGKHESVYDGPEGSKRVASWDDGYSPVTSRPLDFAAAEKRAARIARHIV